MQPAQFRQLPGAAEAPAEAWRVAAEDGIGLRLAHWRPVPPGLGGGGAASGPSEQPAAVGSDGTSSDPAARASRPGAAPASASRSGTGPGASAGDSPAPGRGSVLLFPGRTEYVEKYAPVAARLNAAGLHVLAMDWRGQGASDRLQDDPLPGHVGDFADYQRDVAAMVVAAADLALPRPWHLLAHSMGGTIGLRALSRGLDVASAAFTAPMWGIRFGRLPGPVGPGLAQGIARAAARGGRGSRAVPGPSSVLDTAFNRNPLTGDLDAYIRTLREAAAWPDLAVGGASFDWVGAAVRECRALTAMPSPDLPAVIALCGRDPIVTPGPIQRRAATWRQAHLLSLPASRHEPLFEVPAIRDEVMAAILGLFAAADHGGTGPHGGPPV